MIYVDKYAYFSGFKDFRGDFKVIFGLCTLFTAIAIKSPWAHFFIFLAIFLLLVVKGKIPVRYYFKLLTLPFFFLLFSTVGIILNIGASWRGFLLFHAESLGFYAYITPDGLRFAFRLIMKSLAAVSCMYFIILTTPISEIIAFLRKCRAPKGFLFIMAMIYRFIFLLLEIGTIKMQSQRCRFGYDNFQNAIKSLKMLWGTTLIQSLNANEWHYKSMISRGYQGEIHSLTMKFEWKSREVVVILSFITVILAINFYG